MPLHERSGRIRVAHLTGAPIPHFVPLFRLLAADRRIEFTVIFASTGGVNPADVGHAEPTKWDVDLLSGYRSVFVNRAQSNPVEGGDRSGFLMYRDLDVVPMLMKGQYEVLWLFSYSYLTHLLAAATQLGRRRPLLFQTDQTLIPTERPAWKDVVKAVVLPRMLKRVYGLYVGAESRKWMEHYGVAKDRLYFAPYCTADTAFPSDPVAARPNHEARSQFNIRDDSGPVILMVARLIPKKNPLLLLKAFQIVRGDTRCNLLLVGSGELEERLRRYVREEAVPDVIFAGFVNRSQIARVYAAADIFVLPSASRETWGTVVNEAMQSALPVIVSDQVGCAPDLVRPGDNGFIVANDSVEALAGALRVLVENEPLRREFGQKSLALIQPWSHSVAATGVLAAIRAAVGTRRWKAATSPSADQ